ncbi:hypothetical protein PAPYR_6420 [Paratrimastix pyriformis]|uniref:Uncharacterized protein n=1 Tax=Paratrimastix pyriformis TaxID=342808 RepID=A0ABQ8UF82_9EUKA|nr:hypothetical protein PAPYR_6420 [Paratrimastix pyriformis]
MRKICWRHICFEFPQFLDEELDQLEFSLYRSHHQGEKSEQPGGSPSDDEPATFVQWQQRWREVVEKRTRIETALWQKERQDAAPFSPRFLSKSLGAVSKVAQVVHPNKKPPPRRSSADADRAFRQYLSASARIRSPAGSPAAAAPPRPSTQSVARSPRGPLPIRDEFEFFKSESHLTDAQAHALVARLRRVRDPPRLGDPMGMGDWIKLMGSMGISNPSLVERLFEGLNFLERDRLYLTQVGLVAGSFAADLPDDENGVPAAHLRCKTNVLSRPIVTAVMLLLCPKKSPQEIARLLAAMDASRALGTTPMPTITATEFFTRPDHFGALLEPLARIFTAFVLVEHPPSPPEARRALPPPSAPGCPRAHTSASLQALPFADLDRPFTTAVGARVLPPLGAPSPFPPAVTTTTPATPESGGSPPILTTPLTTTPSPMRSPATTPASTTPASTTPASTAPSPVATASPGASLSPPSFTVASPPLPLRHSTSALRMGDIQTPPQTATAGEEPDAQQAVFLPQQNLFLSVSPQDGWPPPSEWMSPSQGRDPLKPAPSPALMLPAGPGLSPDTPLARPHTTAGGGGGGATRAHLKSKEELRAAVLGVHSMAPQPGEGPLVFDCTSTPLRANFSIRDPKLFEETSLQPLEVPGISVTLGIRRQTGQPEAICIHFDRAKWTDPAARRWWQTEGRLRFGAREWVWAPR